MKQCSDPSSTWELSSAGSKTILSLTELHMTNDWSVLTTALGRCISCSSSPLKFSAFTFTFYPALLLGKKQDIISLPYHLCCLMLLPSFFLSSSFWLKTNPPPSWVFFGERCVTSPLPNHNIPSCSLNWVTLSKMAASPWHRVSLGPGLWAGKELC